MSVFSEYKSKLNIACDRRRPGIVRAFAFAELVCQPVSIVSVAVAIAFAVLRRTGLWTPPEAVIKSFEKQGFVWGGTWDEYDTMHFEYRPELIELGKLMQD